MIRKLCTLACRLSPKSPGVGDPRSAACLAARCRNPRSHGCTGEREEQGEFVTGKDGLGAAAFPQVDLLAAAIELPNSCDASQIIGRDAQAAWSGPDLGGISQIDLVADGLRLGAAHRGHLLMHAV